MAYMTTAQALVKFLDNQYVSFDGKETNSLTEFLRYSVTE